MSVAWVGAAVAVGGAVAQSNASSNASKAQQTAANQANATSQAQYEQTRLDQLAQYKQQRDDQMPWMQRGNEAGNRLQYLLGLSPTGYQIEGTEGAQSDPYAEGNLLTRDQLRDELIGSYTTKATNVFEQLDPNMVNAMPEWYTQDQLRKHQYSLDGVMQGADIVDYERLNAEIERKMAEQEAGIKARDEARKAQQLAAGQAAKNDPNYGSLLAKFSKRDLDQDLVYQNGLQFGLNEGVKGINRMAAAGGGLNSGATLKALTRFGNDYATTKTGGAYDRFNNNKQQTYNMLAGVSGTGQVATNQMGAAGQNMVNQISGYGAQNAARIGENQIGAGNARASSYVAQGNALTGAIGQGYNAYQRSQLGAYSPNTYGTGSMNYSGYNAAANGGWGIE